jgi:ATP-dependent Clp protease ATP-binding subunit ClpA
VFFLEEPKDPLALQIVLNALPEMERKNGITITFTAAKLAVNLSHHFAFDKVLPDKAMELLEEAIVAAKESNLKFVGEDLVDKLVSDKVGMDVGKIEKSESVKLINLEEKIHKRFIDQNEAVVVANALEDSGGSWNRKPWNTFFLTGVN